MKLFYSSDFSINLTKFNLSNTSNILRIICSLFLIPEVFGKFNGFMQLNLNIVNFFASVGLNPPEFWVYSAALGELLCGLALVFGICTRYAALGAALILFVAVIALNIVRGHFAWTWSIGGDEYLIFWIICCCIVALNDFKALTE